MDISIRRREVSNLKPTNRFADLVVTSGVTRGDFGADPDEEVIRVFRKIERTGGLSRERADYEDTPEAETMRAAVKRLNAFLAAADISFVPDGLSPEVNAGSRTLARHFPTDPNGIPKFNEIGRLYGAFWVNLPAARRHAIRIGGESVADLDFSNMFVRLAYAHLGETPPEGDLYALPGLDGYRSGVKLAMNTLVWDARKSRKSWPPQMGVGRGDDKDAEANPQGIAATFKGRLPPGWTKVSMLTATIRLHHPKLQPIFGRGLGGVLMFKESEVMMAILSRLMNEGVVALPLHDGLMVALSTVELTKAIMVQVAEEVTGLVFPVAEKPITGPL